MTGRPTSSRTRAAQLVLLSLAVACIAAISATAALAREPTQRSPTGRSRSVLPRGSPRSSADGARILTGREGRAVLRAQPHRSQHLQRLGLGRHARRHLGVRELPALAPRRSPQRVLWFLDVESLERSKPNPGLLATPQLAPYLLSPPQTAPRGVASAACAPAPGRPTAHAGSARMTSTMPPWSATSHSVARWRSRSLTTGRRTSGFPTSSLPPSTASSRRSR